VSPLKIKIPSKDLDMQRCAEGFNSGVKGLNVVSFHKQFTAKEYILLFL
jgi:hypothetical protein